MRTKAASPIVFSIVVLAGAGCAARMDATPEAASSAAAPRSAPQPVANPSAASGRPGPGERRDDPNPAPIETSTIATPPAAANAPPSSSAPAYVFAPDQVAIALPSEPAATAPHDAAPRDRAEGPPRVTPGELRLAVVAPAKAIAAGAIISVDVMASSRSPVVDAPLHLVFDPSVLEFVDGTPGDFLAQRGSSIVFLADGTTVPGDVAVAAGRTEREHGASGDGLLCRVRFRGIGAGTTAVVVSEAKGWGAGGEALTVLAGRTDIVVR
jgi:hypothetical protein